MNSCQRVMGRLRGEAVDRAPNFDIFLPEWLARHNKTIFGILYLAGVVYLILSWAAQRP